MDGHFQSFIYIKYHKQFGEGTEMFVLGREAPVSIVGAVWPQKLHGWVAHNFVFCARE